jgi:hypothetical protein
MHNMIIHRMIFKVALSCSLLFINILKAEDSPVTDNDHNSTGWFSFGIGGSYIGLTGYYSLSYAYKANIFTIRYLCADEFRYNVDGVYDNPSLNIREKGILYGRSYRKEFLVLSISCGVGFINGVDRGKKITEHEYEKINIGTYGMPFEARFRFEFGFIGIGGAWFGNINSQKILSGGMVEISLGLF